MYRVYPCSNVISTEPFADATFVTSTALAGTVAAAIVLFWIFSTITATIGVRSRNMSPAAATLTLPFSSPPKIHA